MTPLPEQVQTLALAVQQGKMTRDMFLALVLPLISTMRAKTAVQAETALCKTLKVKPFGLYLPDATEHYRESFTTVFDEGLDIEQGTPDRLTSLVEAIEQDAKDLSAQKAMKIHQVEQYQFVAGANACQNCREDDGKIYPVSVRPSHHNNCRCEATPLRENPDERTEQQPRQQRSNRGTSRGTSRGSNRARGNRFSVSFGGR